MQILRVLKGWSLVACPSFSTLYSIVLPSILFKLCRRCQLDKEVADRVRFNWPNEGISLLCSSVLSQTGGFFQRILKEDFISLFLIVRSVQCLERRI